MCAGYNDESTKSVISFYML